MQPWYPFYWAKYSGKTHHLTMAQHGAYMLLLRFTYTTGKPIPHKQRFSIARASLEQEQSDVDLVLEEFFRRKSDLWYNDSALEVIDQADKRHQAYVAAGKIGGKRRYSKAGSDATASLEPSHSNNKYKYKEKASASARGPSGAPSAPPMKKIEGPLSPQSTDETVVDLAKSIPAFLRRQTA